MDSMAWIIYLVGNGKARLAPGLLAFAADAIYVGRLVQDLTGTDILIDCVPWAAAYERYTQFVRDTAENPGDTEWELAKLEQYFRLVGNLPPGV